MRRTGGAVLMAVVVAVSVTACGSAGSSGAGDDSTTSSTESPVSTSSTSSTVAPSPTRTVLVDFADPSSITGWRSVDDSVMGGISASTTTWTDGVLVFEGMMTTESNGGFTSTLGPFDRRLGDAAAGATSLGIDAVGDGRTFVLQVRAGANGSELWIARFTPLSYAERTGGNLVLVPVESFTPVDRFLRPRTSATPFDPSSIVQMAVYLIDGQVGEFRLAIRSFVAER